MEEWLIKCIATDGTDAPSLRAIASDMFTTGMGGDGYLIGKAHPTAPVELIFASKGLMLDALGSLYGIGRLVTQAYTTNTVGNTLYIVCVYA